MKNTKMLAIVLVVAVMLMGAGYAYWSETLEIGATVTTGSFDVVFDNINDSDMEEIAESVADLAGIDIDVDDYMSVSSSLSNDDHDLNFTVTDIYPGSGGFLTFEIKNTGTVPAEVTGVDGIVPADKLALSNNFKYVLGSIGVLHYDAPIVGEGDIDWLDITPIVASSVSEFASAIESELAGVTIEPGDSLVVNYPASYSIQDIFPDFPFDFGVDVNYASEEYIYSLILPGSIDDNDLEGQNLTFDLTLDFEQPHN